MQEVADDHVCVRHLSRVCEGYKSAFPQINRYNGLRAERGYNRSMPPLSTATLENRLAPKIFSGYGRNPIKELLGVVASQITPSCLLFCEA